MTSTSSASKTPLRGAAVGHPGDDDHLGTVRADRPQRGRGGDALRAGHLGRALLLGVLLALLRREDLLLGEDLLRAAQPGLGEVVDGDPHAGAAVDAHRREVEGAARGVGRGALDGQQRLAVDLAEDVGGRARAT